MPEEIQPQQPNISPTPPEPSGSWFSKNKLSGYGFLVLILILVTGGIYLWQYGDDQITDNKEQITNFEECIAAGYPAMESYPRQCRTEDGRTFVEEIPDVTINWQTYTSDEFEFKYPPNMVTSLDSSLDKQVIVEGKNLEFLVSDQDTKLETKFLYPPSGEIVELPEILIGSRKWYKWEPGDGGGMSILIYKTELGERTFQVSFGQYIKGWVDEAGANEVYNNKLYSDTEQQKIILSTVKFIDQISNWETYRNAGFGFEFKYPKDHSVFTGLNENQDAFILATSESDSVRIVENEDLAFCCEAPGLTVTIEDSELSAEEWISANFSKYSTLEQKDQNHANLDFKGFSGGVMFGAGNIGSVYQLMVIEKDNKLVIISQDVKSVFLDQILSTFKFVEAEEQTFQYDEAKGYFGTLELTGFLDIVEKTDQAGKINDYAFFVITDTNNDLIYNTLPDVEYSYNGPNKIGLGCYDRVNKKISSGNAGDDGWVQNTIEGDQFDLLDSSSTDTNVNLELTKAIYTSGGGAPTCYSLFRDFKVLE